VWGYDQDPSGFKRWAVDRRGAFRELLEKVEDQSTLELAFRKTLGRYLNSEAAVRAGAVTTDFQATAVDPDIALPIALAAASSANRLYLRRGPEPTWFKKSRKWRSGPDWIENVYPPRPAWTRWDTGQDERLPR
jgi:hypothetical protein